MLTQSQLKYKKILIIASVVALILAIPSIFPYGYFQLLRWLVAGTAAYLAYLLHHTKKIGWMWAMIVIAVLFNPIAPIFLSKGLWAVIDMATIVVLIIVGRTIKTNK